MTDYKFTPDEMPSMSNFNKRFEVLNTLNADLYSYYWNKYEINFEDYADGSTTDALAINPPIRLFTDKQPAPSIVDRKFDFSGATKYSLSSGNSVDFYNRYKFVTGEEKADTYYEATGSGDIYNNNVWYIIEPAAKIHRIKYTIGALVGVVKSDNPNAYPKSGFSGEYYYEYLGSPFENAQIAAKIDKGSYVGTGTYGESHPNSLTFDFVPKLVIVSGQGKSSDTGAGFIYCWGSGKYTLLYAGYGGAQTSCVVSLAGKTMNWYDTQMVNFQCNDSGYIFNYIAIG